MRCLAIYRKPYGANVTAMAIPLSRLFSQNAIAPKNPAMPIHHPIETNATAAILAPRLLQAACIILCSLLRLITSDNDIASIMDIMPVSIDHRSSLARLRYDTGNASLVSTAQRTA